MSAELIVEDVTWAPSLRAPHLLERTSFSVQPGQVMGVVGPNGAGKSSLLRVLYRYNKPLTGQVLVGGQDIWAVDPRAAARKVAAVLQEQPTDFALTVREIVALGRVPYRHGLVAGSACEADIIDGAMAQVDLLPFSNRPLGSLSGGERQRVMVARALAQQPEVLVLDEPTNHLDIRHQLEVLDLIRRLDVTVVTSLHDLNLASGVCDDILVLNHGKTVAVGAAADVLSEDLVADAFQVHAREDWLNRSSMRHFTFHLHSKGVPIQ